MNYTRVLLILKILYNLNNITFSIKNSTDGSKTSYIFEIMLLAGAVTNCLYCKGCLSHFFAIWVAKSKKCTINLKN